MPLGSLDSIMKVINVFDEAVLSDIDYISSIYDKILFECNGCNNTIRATHLGKTVKKVTGLPSDGLTSPNIRIKDLS
jgi:hypothetical protein